VKRRVIQPPPRSPELSKLLSVDEVADIIRRHPEVVRRQARDGRLPAEKIGRVWFFRPDRLAEAGFSQFSTSADEQRQADNATAGNSEGAASQPLLEALSEAGLQALRRPDRDAIFHAVGSRLAEAGLSTYLWDRSPDDTGLIVAYRHIVGAGGDANPTLRTHEVGGLLQFDRIPVLHKVCTTMEPQYIGDQEELVGRVARALPGQATRAREVSRLLQLHAVVSAPLVVADRAIGAITVMGPNLRRADLPAIMAFANQTAAALEAARLLAESRDVEEAAVLTLATAIELREALHSRSQEHANLAERFAQHLGLDAAQCRRVRYTALLQDLGKLSLPDSIVKKHGRLDSEGRALLMTHPVVASDLLQKFKPLAELAPLVRSHHEWFNGEGYPDGIRGEAIPLETRIISIVNAFFSVTFYLPQKTEKTVEEGLDEMTHFAGINLDPELTKAFVRMCRDGHAKQLGWYEEMFGDLVGSSELPPPSGPRDILGVADSRELRIIYRIAQETTAVLDLSTLLNRIVNIIRDVMGYYMVSIVLPTDRPGELRVGAHSGYEPDITGMAIPVGKGITGWVFTHGIPEIISDVGRDPRYIGVDDKVRSELAFPLISRGRVVGVLNAESDQLDAFSESDVALMSAVGSQLASCLEVAQLHDTLKREASHDPLTRLYNRRLFLERIQQEIARAENSKESFSILFLDVDELKRINDNYGHLAGDALLREVSNALMDAVRGEDVVARYGGDEFVVLLPATNRAAATSVAQRISEGIARHRFMAGRELLEIPGVSLGVATYPIDGANAEQLLSAADVTLYRQKRRAS
jgi:diguanylate cyclase (GGDEF)-like protein